MHSQPPAIEVAPYTLRRGPDGIELGHAVLGGGRSVLGPLRLYFDLADASGRTLELSDAVLREESAEQTADAFRITFGSAALPGARFEVAIELSAAGLILRPTVQAGVAALQLRAFRVVARPPAESLLSGVGCDPGWRVLGAGYSSFSPVGSRDSRHILTPPTYPSAGTFSQLSQSSYWGRREALSSPWMLTLTKKIIASESERLRPKAITILLGFLAAETGLGEVALLRSGTRSRIEARLSWSGRKLAPGCRVTGEPLLICASTDGDDLVRSWTARTAQHMSARPSQLVPSGWCSWYYYYTGISEAAVFTNLSALTQQRASLPVRYVQLDDGYQKSVGDWLTVNAKFPSGLAALAQRIRDAGFVPGIWVAPFLVQRSSSIFRQHKSWLLRDTDGKLRRLGYNPTWGVLRGQVYSLDPTHPEVQDFLRTVFQTLCTAGFEYFKIDFLFAGLREGQHHDAQQTPVQAYRSGLRCIREAIGERFLLGCGAPLLPSIGVVDAMRISPDVKEVWIDPQIALFTGEAGYPAAELSILNCLTRAHLHGRFWINDPDCLLVRDQRSKLTIAEVQTLVSVLSLTGGMLFLSDDLRALAPARRALAELALPPAGEAAQALGVFFESKPERFVRTRTLDKTAGGGTEALAAIINFGAQPLDRSVLPQELGLPAGVYHAYEYWTRSYQRLAIGQAFVTTQPPHGTALLLLRPLHPWPQVITVTHHLGQTTVLLAHEAWEPAAATLVVSLHTLAARTGEVLLGIPPSWQLTEVTTTSGLTIDSWGRAPAGARVAVTFTGVGTTETLTLHFLPPPHESS